MKISRKCRAVAIFQLHHIIVFLFCRLSHFFSPSCRIPRCIFLSNSSSSTLLRSRCLLKAENMQNSCQVWQFLQTFAVNTATVRQIGMDVRIIYATECIIFICRADFCGANGWWKSYNQSRLLFETPTCRAASLSEQLPDRRTSADRAIATKVEQQIQRNTDR